MEYYNEDAYIFNELQSLDSSPSYSNHLESDAEWLNRCDILSDNRPLGCQGANFGFANDIPLGGDEFISRTTLTRQLLID